MCYFFIWFINHLIDEKNAFKHSYLNQIKEIQKDDQLAKVDGYTSAGSFLF